MAGSDFVEMFVGVGAARVRGKNHFFLFKFFFKKNCHFALFNFFHLFISFIRPLHKG